MPVGAGGDSEEPIYRLLFEGFGASHGEDRQLMLIRKTSSRMA